MRAKYPQESMERLCGLYGRSRQAWYEKCWRIWDREVEAEVVADLIREICRGFNMGIHNLYPVLKPRLIERGIKIGRAKVQEIRREYGLSIVRKRKKIKTTNSNHRWRKWPFLAEGLVPQGPESLWVSDITYILIRGGFAYLSLITDAYSRKIMGYHLHRDLSTKGCMIALEMALAARMYPEQLLIHHSDRGTQYCSGMYTDALLKAGVAISMGRKGQVLDNAIAERMNGILKDNYGMDHNFASLKEARALLDSAIEHYNEIKPHSSIERLRPAEAHLLCGLLERKWKNSYRKTMEKQAVDEFF